MKKKLIWLAIAILALASIKTLWILASVLILEGQTRLMGDDGTFFTVAKGLINGKDLYSEFFEMKPPGLLFLNAISLLIANNEIPLNIFKIVCFALIPISFVWFAIRNLKESSVFLRTIGVCTSLIFGGAISIYSIERIVGLQAESFGAPFAIMYVLVVAWDTKKMTPLRIILASIFIAASMGMREQFLFPLVAVSMILSKDIKFFVKSFVIPCAIAFALGTLIMLLLGFLGSYLSIYLPDAFSVRIQTNQLGSLWMRGLHGWILMLDLSLLFLLPVFGIAFGALLASVPLLKSEISKWKEFASVLVCSASGMIVFNLTFIAYILSKTELEHTIAQYSDYVYAICAVSLVAFAASLLELVRINRKVIAHIFVAILAFYPVSLAAGASHFNIYQRTNIAPLCAAVFLLFLIALPKIKNSKMRIIAGVLVGLIALIPFIMPPINWEERSAKVTKENENYIASMQKTSELDAMMDKCGFNNYIGIGAGFLLPDHLPLQMGWSAFRSFGSNQSQHFRAQTFGNIKKSEFLFIDPTWEDFTSDQKLTSVLNSEFTTKLPTCASDYQVPEGYGGYWRN
ncbi:MAG: hypothetical protein QF741_01110 [Candidatus Peribacteraceae bacterium]|jgi:hypothetical protein|nr:hypothetical protein [Candidatus Peribacteraceae bacterium]MDP7454278.1 hypothetical protein [Candidatus Peribacteraceae bacterium]MDP7645768.1 hypothetical protein [Candidatus Peribacteraceae bacterium]